MSSTTTQTTIINRALQLLGVKQVSNINDNDRGARAMNRAYLSVRDSMLRDNYWGFAVKRASLPASATPPVFGPSYSYPLPSDFLCLAPTDPVIGVNFGGPLSGPPTTNDWQIEGQAISSNMAPPLQIRYISSAVTESMFDPSFAEALAANLAMNTCEEITNSNSKLVAAGKMYDDAIEQAKQRNAFEAKPLKQPVNTWISMRF